MIHQIVSWNWQIYFNVVQFPHYNTDPSLRFDELSSCACLQRLSDETLNYSFITTQRPPLSGPSWRIKPLVCRTLRSRRRQSLHQLWNALQAKLMFLGHLLGHFLGHSFVQSLSADWIYFSCLSESLVAFWPPTSPPTSPPTFVICTNFVRLMVLELLLFNSASSSDVLLGFFWFASLSRHQVLFFDDIFGDILRNTLGNTICNTLCWSQKCYCHKNTVDCPPVSYSRFHFEKKKGQISDH